MIGGLESSHPTPGPRLYPESFRILSEAKGEESAERLVAWCMASHGRRYQPLLRSRCLFTPLARQ